MIGCVLMVVGAVLGAFANGYGMYVGGRFILGFGNSMAHLASPVLLTEICHPQHRARVTAIYNTLWNVGAVLVSWTAWGTIQIDNDWSWRSITLLQGVFSVIQIFFIWWVPESPRWLISKDRNEEALAMLAKYHGEGDPNNKTVQFEWQEIKETIHLELAAKKSSSYFDFFKTKGNRYRLMLLIALGIISQYSGNAIISNYSNLIYENAGIKSQNQKIPLNGGQTLLSLIVGVIAASTVDKIGRRPLFLTATAGMCLMFTAWTITSAQYEKTGNVKTTGYPQIVWIWLYSVSYAFAWSGLLVAYALEILPFKLRAKGLLIMNMTVQCVLVLGNYTNPIAWEKLPQKWNLALIYTIWIFVELAFVYFFFVETKGPTLEELAKLFDGEDAEVAHIDLNNEKEERISEHSDEKRAPNTTSTAL
jgi:sugar porter (SP) family MFS transporter